jgi:hypothetical protein
MQSSLIGKVQKAHRYAQERHRMTIDGLHVRFAGENSEHEITLRDGTWDCNCEFFRSWAICSHTMAIEQVLTGMVPAQQVPAPALAS